MNRVIYVAAPFKPVGNSVTVKVPTGETKKGLFGGPKPVLRDEHQWEQTGWSNCEVDGTTLTAEIATAVAALNNDGYTVISITPITSGAYAYREIESGRSMIEAREAIHGGGYGYGYSYTEGVIITAQLTAR